MRPLLVMADHTGGRKMLLLAGARRREALLALDAVTAPALILPSNLSLQEALGLALTDNLDRGWNAAEQALAWRFLSVNLPAKDALSLSAHLGLDKTPKLRDWCLKASDLPANVLAALADDRLDLESASRLAGWEPASRDAVFQLFEELAPSKQKKRQWLDWLEDIGRREGLLPMEILAAPDLTSVLAQAHKKGRPAVEKLAREVLWRRRYPLVAELTRRRQETVRSLNLPAEARLELDPAFEDLKFSLNLTFTDWAGFNVLAGLVDDLRQNTKFQGLIEDTYE